MAKIVYRCTHFLYSMDSKGLVSVKQTLQKKDKGGSGIVSTSRC